MSALGRRWRLRGRFPDDALADAPYPALIRHLLWCRGIRTGEEARRFLEGPDVGSGEFDPLLLPDMERALGRLAQAVRHRETVAVFGDFDVDGVTASAVLTQGLRALGAWVIPYIPDRFSEGYGLNLRALEMLRHMRASVLITADCGTSSQQEIDYAARLGMDVVILDHHSVPPRLPPALAVINPKRPDSRYPDPELTSVGLSYKLVAALYEALERPWEGQRYLELVAIGTVADMAPLQRENRCLVREGLRALARTERPGLLALMEASGVVPSSVDADTIGYALAPRINAAGRLAHARLAFELLLEREEGLAVERALELAALNQERQRLTQAALDLAQELLALEDPQAPLIFLGHRDMPVGIVGLVAGRIAEERYRPTVVYEAGPEQSRGSCRSIPEFDIIEALRRCAGLMLRFGGHRAAAGFTAANDRLPALKEALMRQAEEALEGIELTPVIDIDAALPLGRLGGREIRWLSRMAPFGQGNPEPTFLSRGVEVLEVRALGSDGRHLGLKLRAGQAVWPAVAFDLGAKVTAEGGISPGQRLDIVYSLMTQRGADGALELRIKDLAPASGQGEAP